MAAGLEADIGSPISGSVARPAERLGLAMRSPARLRPAAPNDPTLVDDDATDRRVWPDSAEPTERQSERCSHCVLVQAPAIW
jgi:hypothetical protein